MYWVKIFLKCSRFSEFGVYTADNVISRITGIIIETDRSGEIIDQLDKLRGPHTKRLV